MTDAGGGATSGAVDLWIEAEEWPAGEWTPADDVTDVVVTLADGSRWVASCCAFAHLPTLRDRCAESGENLGGRYLWASELILVEDTARPTLEAVVRDLIDRGDLASAFAPLVEGEGEEAADEATPDGAAGTAPGGPADDLAVEPDADERDGPETFRRSGR